MKTVKRLLVGAGALVVVLALLSLTLFNKQFPLMRMSSLMREGRLAMETRDYDAAVSAYRLAISLNGRSAQAYLKLAEAYKMGGQPLEARYALEMGMKKTNSKRIRDAYNDLLKTAAFSPPPSSDGAL
ncbi:MAG: hypothetical protein LBH95_07815 [Oscillospiraceae bacterium]|jgi:tetratricopeptide (TPR) repeat protein|nr:hypothetical protein [Oscillospiraceae bacterium]